MNKRLNAIEFLLIAYFLLGGIISTNFSFISQIEYYISILLQFLILLIIFNKKYIKLNTYVIYIYLFNLFSLLFLFSFFLFSGIEFGIVFNRIITLFSVVGMVLLLSLEKNRYFNLEQVLKIVIYGYAVLGILILVDIAIFNFLDIALWPPISYIGNRFTGPFYDSNFYGLYYATLFIITIYYKFDSIKFKAIIKTIFIFNIFLSFSWSILGTLLFTFLITKFVKFKNLLLKQLILLFLYIVVLSIYSTYNLYLREVFVSIFSIITNYSIIELNIKFTSLAYRFDAQIEALKILEENLLGLGPLTIVEYLGRDTHNSYVGVTFELGVIGFILILFNFGLRTNYYNKLVDVLSTFLFLMALSLNIHYLNLLPLVLLLSQSISSKYKNLN